MMEIERRAEVEVNRLPGLGYGLQVLCNHGVEGGVVIGMTHMTWRAPILIHSTIIITLLPIHDSSVGLKTLVLDIVFN